MTSIDGCARPDGPPDAARGETRLAFLDMMKSLRAMLDGLTAAVPSDADIAVLAGQFRDIGERLSRYAVPEAEQWAGRFFDIPGRGQAMAPPIAFDELAEGRARARVTLGRFYVGGGAAHGGVVALVLDEFLGRLLNSDADRPVRTAYLHVNFRKLTPIETELTLTGRLDRRDGRKFFLSGELSAGHLVVADAEGLFVAPREG